MTISSPGFARPLGHGLGLLLPLLAAACLAAAPAGTPASFDQARAWEHLRAQCAFGPRHVGSPGYAPCLDYLERALRKETEAAQVLGRPARTHRQDLTASVAGRQVRFTNVLAHFPTDEPRPRGHVLLCAHWDTRPRADQEPDPARRNTPIMGANDGASGVAVLLEMARLLAARPCPYAVTIALFDGEDYALAPQEMVAGSRAYAANPWPARPDWGVLLDMVGDREITFRPEGHSLAHARQVVERIWEAAARAGSPAFSRGPGVGVMDDHWPLIAAGIPTADVIDYPYPHWHRITDTVEQCSADSLGQVGRMLQALLWP